MKRLKLILLCFVFISGTFSSCDEKLDINTDPLAATSADPNAVLPFVFVQYSSRKVTELGTRICDVSQYISNTFNSPKNGSTSIFLTGNTWGMMYNQILGNLSLVKADAAAAGPTSNNVNAIATILSAHIYFELTSIWEDVPYSEALNGQDFPSPNFDRQEDVLNAVVGLYDEAIALIDSRQLDGEFTIQTTADQYYGGDMDKWRILANSLKLRALMLLRNGGASVDAQINATLAQPLMSSNDEGAYLIYTGAPGAQNAMKTIITAFFGPDNESQNVFGPGPPIDNLLRGTGDPRYDLWVARNDLPAPELAFFPDNSTSVLSNNIIRFDLPDMLMLPSEIDLYKAELALEGFAAAGSADANYRAGITNSLRWWGQDIPGVLATITEADITGYVSSLPAPSIVDVYEQQYLAAFLQPVMAWTHVRRNQVPVLDAPPASTIGTTLRRFNYPPDEVTSNPNTPANLPTETPMWFEN